MRLYFYSLRTNKESKPYLKIEECEVFKEGGLYCPQKGLFPIGNGRFENPKHIGEVQIDRWGYELPYIVLTEPNMEHVKKVLIDGYIDKKLEFYKKKIAEFEEKRKVVKQAKE